MDGPLLGETAALVASVLWTFTSIAFTVASRRVGALSVNLLRLALAVGLLAASHVVLLGVLLPRANQAQWLYLGASGIIGLAIGDLGYFGALVLLGPRRGTLLMATSPIFSVVFGYLALSEGLTAWSGLGIALTLAGVTWVVLEKEEASGEPALPEKKKMLGILAGVMGSAGQGLGLVVSKYGMMNAADDPSQPLDPLSASLMRMVAATAFFLIVMLILRRMGEVRRALSDRPGMAATFAGTLIGPFLGVWTFMVAVTHAVAGVAATLGSLMPVFVIPVVWVLYRQRTSWRGVLGALVAIVGVGVLMLHGSLGLS